MRMQRSSSSTLAARLIEERPPVCDVLFVVGKVIADDIRAERYEEALALCLVLMGLPAPGQEVLLAVVA